MAMFDGHIRRLGDVPRAAIDALLGRLDARLAAVPDYWALHDGMKPNKDAAFAGSTQHIVLGFPEDSTSARTSFRAPAWDHWEDVIQPVVDAVVATYGYPRGQVNRIMLARLRAGGEIARHIDADRSAWLPHKIHVPLLTNDGVELWVGDANYHLEVGAAYEVNNRISHGGANRGHTDRVHLIFDYVDVARLAEEP